MSFQLDFHKDFSAFVSLYHILQEEYNFSFYLSFETFEEYNFDEIEEVRNYENPDIGHDFINNNIVDLENNLEEIKNIIFDRNYLETRDATTNELLYKDIECEADKDELKTFLNTKINMKRFMIYHDSIKYDLRKFLIKKTKIYDIIYSFMLFVKDNCSCEYNGMDFIEENNHFCGCCYAKISIYKNGIVCSF